MWILNRVNLTLCLALLSVGTVLAQSPEVPAKPPIPWANKLFLPNIDDDRTQMPPFEVLHDFGTVAKGTLLVHRFTLTNIYDAPMQVTEMRRSTEALQAFPPQRIVQPNEKADFVVTVDTSKINSNVSETVYVSVGPSFVSTARLRVSAVVRSDVSLSPGSMNFVNVSQGTRAEQTITLDYSGKQRDWKILGALASEIYDTTVADMGRGKFKITVKLKAEAPAGPLNEVVTLTTNDPTIPQFQFGLRATIQGLIEVSTPKITFTKAKVGETLSARVIVRGNGVGAFTIGELEDMGNGVSVQTIGVASPVHTIVVNFTPTKPGPFKQQIKLKTNLKNNATVDITLEGEVEG